MSVSNTIERDALKTSHGRHINYSCHFTFSFLDQQLTVLNYSPFHPIDIIKENFGYIIL